MPAIAVLNYDFRELPVKGLPLLFGFGIANTGTWGGCSSGCALLSSFENSAIAASGTLTSTVTPTCTGTSVGTAAGTAAGLFRLTMSRNSLHLLMTCKDIKISRFQDLKKDNSLDLLHMTSFRLLPTSAAILSQRSTSDAGCFFIAVSRDLQLGLGLGVPS